MKPNHLRVWLPAIICVLCPPGVTYGQAVPHPDSTATVQRGGPNEAGSVTGVVKDPSGAVVRGAKVEIENQTSGL